MSEAGCNELDETLEEKDPLTDGEFHTDDEIDDNDLVIANPGAERSSSDKTLKSHRSTPLRSLLNAAGSIRSWSGSKPRSNSRGKVGSNLGSRRDSNTGSLVEHNLVSKEGSKPTSPNASERSRNKEGVMIRGNGPMPSYEERNEDSRSNSLPVVLEEGVGCDVDFSHQQVLSRTPSEFAMSRAQSPSLDKLKTPTQSASITPRKGMNLNSTIKKDIEINLESAADFVEICGENNIAFLNEVGGTPLQKLRSRANSLLQGVGSRMPSRKQSRNASRLGSPVVSRTSRNANHGENVNKTLELAADALAEQGENKDSMKDKAAENVGQKENVTGEIAAAGNSNVYFAMMKCI